MKSLLLGLAVLPVIAGAAVVIVDDKPVVPKPKLAVVSGQAGAPNSMPSYSNPPPLKRIEAPIKRWEVRVSDVRLAGTFERWASEGASDGKPAYKILWDAEKHVLIDATPAYGGSLLDAVEAALSTPAIRRGAYPLEACLYQNSPPLIRITKRGEQTEACPDTK